LCQADLDDGDGTSGGLATSASISWRGDSSIFVVNIEIDGGFKCLTRDAQNLNVIKGPARADDQTVFSVAEKPIAHLTKPCCIMPNGSLVAGFQAGNKREVCFWEKNGLRHGEFELPDQSLRVTAIEFNQDSTLMALLCLGDDGSQAILVLSRSNWMWQIKQRL